MILAKIMILKITKVINGPLHCGTIPHHGTRSPYRDQEKIEITLKRLEKNAAALCN